MPTLARTRCALLILALHAVPIAAERWAQFSSFTGFTSVADDGNHIWIGTRGGLIRIGKGTADTEYFNPINSPLTDSRIRNLASDGKGGTAAVTYGGCLAVFQAGAWDSSEAFAALRGQSALDAAWDRPGSLWVLASDQATGRLSVLHREKGEWNRTSLPAFDSVSIWKGDFSAINYSEYSTTANFPRLQTDTLGRAWVSANLNYRRKAFRIDADGSAQAVASPDSLVPIQMIVPPSGEPFWLCSRVIAKKIPGGWETDSLPGPGYASACALMNPRQVYVRASDGSEIWSFAMYGPYRRSGGRWERAPLIPGSPWTNPDPAFITAAVPAGGNSPGTPEAYAAQGNRFAVFAAGEWSYADPSRAQLRSFNDLGVRAGGPHGERIAMASSAGIDTFDTRAGRFLPVDLGPEWGPYGPYSLFADREGRLWTAGYYATGFLKIGEEPILSPRDGKWGGLRSFNGTVNDFMAEDAAGTLWIADSSRLISAPGGSTDNRTWGMHPVPSSWGAKPYIKTISAHPDGSIWASVPLYKDQWVERPARFNGEVWTLFDSLPEDGIRPGTLSDLRCDSAGNVWALYPDGLWHWNGRTWMTHSWQSSPLLGNGISSIAIDPQGALWAATAPPGASLLRWANGWQAVPDFATKLGTITVKSMARDGTGRFWLATLHDGMFAFDPAASPTSLARLPGTPAGDGRALRRRPDGSWLLDLGPWQGSGGLSARILDLRGRAVPGTRLRLIRRAEGGWVWPGPGPALAPGRYILSVEGPQSRRWGLPFLFAGH